MKIQNTQFQGVVDPEARRRQSVSGGDEFGQMLAGCLDGDAAVTGATASSANAAAVLGTQMALASGDTEDELEEVLSGLDRLFAQMDEYGATLSAGTDLKSAHARLQDLTRGIAYLRDNADLSANPDLAAMVTELDVLATTENFKFNRGDYF